jgi:hypothetical protein
VAGTRDHSSPETRADPSGIPLQDDVVDVHAGGALRPSEVPDACLVERNPDRSIAVPDRELRAFCRRLLGASRARSALVDDAVDGLLVAVARGLPIPLRGAPDLVPVAYALHRRILGADRPFVVCDPRRREGRGSVRMPPSRRTVARALEVARDGSICLRSRRLPADFDLLRESLRHAIPATTVFVCLHGEDRVRDLVCRPLEVCSLAARASESDDLLQEALEEAAAALGAARLCIPRRLRQGALEGVVSFAALEKTALRLTALASARNPSHAAAQLGMAPISLMRWLHRRPGLVAILRELKVDRDRDNG